MMPDQIPAEITPGVWEIVLSPSCRLIAQVVRHPTGVLNVHIPGHRPLPYALPEVIHNGWRFTRRYVPCAAGAEPVEMFLVTDSDGFDAPTLCRDREDAEALVKADGGRIVAGLFIPTGDQP